MSCPSHSPKCHRLGHTKGSEGAASPWPAAATQRRPSSAAGDSGRDARARSPRGARQPPAQSLSGQQRREGASAGAPRRLCGARRGGRGRALERSPPTVREHAWPTGPTPGKGWTLGLPGAYAGSWAEANGAAAVPPRSSPRHTACGPGRAGAGRGSRRTPPPRPRAPALGLATSRPPLRVPASSAGVAAPRSLKQGEAAN